MEQKRNTHVRQSRYQAKPVQASSRKKAAAPKSAVREEIITSRIRENIRIRQQYIILPLPDSEAAAEEDTSV